LRSGARFAAKAMMLSAASDDAAIKETPNNNCYDYGGRGLIV
jgi:hypothetical protein